MKRLAVLTSGGDAPGMNAAVRAVVRCGGALGWQAYGVRGGFAGLVSGALRPLGDRDVGGILHVGGTMLGSARFPEFREESTRRRAIAELERLGIDGLVVIGGDGSQRGSHVLSEMGFPVVGVASTIDNDLYGSDPTIGVESALDVALEAIDRLKVTASSHQRAFLVEVMGRGCGYLAVMVAIAGGSESVAVPERECDPETLAAEIRDAYDRGKPHAIVVVAEGARWNARALVDYFRDHREELGFDLRSVVLGHVQRGAAPKTYDRVLASRLGEGAVAALARGEHGVLVGWRAGAVARTPLAEVVSSRKPLDPSLFQLARTLAR